MCWPETPVEPESDRRHGEDGCFFPRIREIHWLSIISSTVLVFLLVGFVADILMRVLPNDLAGYNLTEESTSGGSGDDFDQGDNGWDFTHSDVFHFLHAEICCMLILMRVPSSWPLALVRG